MPEKTKLQLEAERWAKCLDDAAFFRSQGAGAEADETEREAQELVEKWQKLGIDLKLVAKNEGLVS